MNADTLLIAVADATAAKRIEKDGFVIVGCSSIHWKKFHKLAHVARRRRKIMSSLHSELIPFCIIIYAKEKNDDIFEYKVTNVVPRCRPSPLLHPPQTVWMVFYEPTRLARRNRERRTLRMSLYNKVLILLLCLAIHLASMLIVLKHRGDAKSISVTTNRDDFQPKVLLRQSDLIPPRANKVVRLVFLGDTHGRHDQIPLPLPDGDVLFHLGDSANRGNLSDVQSFAKWIKMNSFKERIVIDGNQDHDYNNSQVDYMNEFDGIARVLRDDVIQVIGGQLTVAGASWNSCETDNYTAVRHRLKQWDDNRVDLLLSHIHPYVQGGGKGWRGSQELAKLVQDFGIPLHCFGHIHYSRGVYQLGLTTMVNVASTWDQPVVIDYSPSRKRVEMIHCPIPNEYLETRLGRNSHLQQFIK